MTAIPTPGPTPIPTRPIPTPGPIRLDPYLAAEPLDLPTVPECLVRIETVRCRRRGPAGWHTPERERRAAELLHALLRTALDRGVHLADFDAACDLPAALYDTVVLQERTEAVSR